MSCSRYAARFIANSGIQLGRHERRSGKQCKRGFVLTQRARSRSTKPPGFAGNFSFCPTESTTFLNMQVTTLCSSVESSNSYQSVVVRSLRKTIFMYTTDHRYLPNSLPRICASVHIKTPHWSDAWRPLLRIPRPSPILRANVLTKSLQTP